jgi:uncharacterized delta-60 repeat protein
VVSLIDNQVGDGNQFFRVVLTNLVGPSYALPGSTLYGSVSNTMVTILDNEMPGNVDYEYMHPSVGVPQPGPDAPVYAVALQNNGQCLIGGGFLRVDDILYNHIARMQSNGVADPYFNPGFGANGNVYALAVTPDSRIVVGGAFTTMDTSNHVGVTRLRANGDLDPSFNPGSGVSGGPVRAVAVQSDGQILLGGEFLQVAGNPRAHLARLQTNGAVDTTFTTVADGPVYALAVQPDGRILLGGAFTNVSGAIRHCVARLMPNGAPDASFGGAANLDGPVYSIALQADGQIVVGGAFLTAGGATNHNCLVRLNPDGSVDPTFDSGQGIGAPVGTLGAVYSVSVALNGRVIIGGNFTNYNGFSRNFFARLRTDGTLDTAFDIGSGANDIVRATTVQSDSAVIIGGDFTVVDQIPRNYLARIHGEERIDRTLVEFAATVFRVKENQTNALIVVQRSGNTNTDFSVSFGTSDGTASNGIDYVGVTNVLHFAPGDLSKTNRITIIDDGMIDGDETVHLTLFNAPPSIDMSGNTSALLVIEDYKPSVRFSSTNYVVRENQTNAVINLVREGDLTGQVSVDFRSYPGTAVPGADYTPVQTNVFFDVNQTTQAVLIPVIYDNVEQDVQTVFLVLTNPVGCYLGLYSNALLNILDANIPLGTPDPAFDPGLGAGSPGGLVRALALNPDGRILVGGAFTTFDGVPHGYFTRLNLDGSQDLAFVTNSGAGANGMVSALGLLPDGRSLLGGAFTNVSGFGFSHIGRLQTNGAVDRSFNQLNNLDSGLTALAVGADGKVFIAGGFTQPSPFLARIRTDGGQDSTFSAGTGPDAIVHTVCLATNGAQPQLLIGGAFGKVNGFPRSRLARLSYNGVVDPAFVPPVISTGVVYAVTTDSQGGVLIGGSFTNVGGASRYGLARLLSDGSLDPDFAPAVAGTVFSIAVEPSGKLLIGGSFNSINQTNNRGNLARLLPGGILDTNFAAGSGANGTVFSILHVPDNSVLIGGAFTTVDGLPRGGVARLIGDPPPSFQLGPVVPGPGQFTLVFNSQPGVTYLVQATTDLLTWADVTTVTATGYVTTINDPAAAGFLFRFYRVSTVGP